MTPNCGDQTSISKLSDSGDGFDLILNFQLLMPSQLWPYINPGIPDELFEHLPEFPLPSEKCDYC